MMMSSKKCIMIPSPVIGRKMPLYMMSAGLTAHRTQAAVISRKPEKNCSKEQVP